MEVRWSERVAHPRLRDRAQRRRWAFFSNLLMLPLSCKSMPTRGDVVRMSPNLIENPLTPEEETENR